MSGAIPPPLSTFLPATRFCPHSDCIIFQSCAFGVTRDVRVKNPRRGQKLGSTLLYVRSGAVHLNELTPQVQMIMLCLLDVRACSFGFGM